MSDPAPLLRLDAVSRQHTRGLAQIEVLKGVSLELERGDVMGVYGQRSRGKTTLLRVASGFEPPDAGTVRFEGRDVAAMRRRELARLHRQDISWVERGGPHVREMPVRAYVALPLCGRVSASEAHWRADAALARVGARECADQRWEDLSDTTQTLVAIAHALVRRPKLVVVDDPTAGLGVVDRDRVVGLLREAAAEERFGVLMAVPDMPAMLHATEIRLLSRGHLIAPSGPRPEGQANVVDFPQHRRSG
jgi:ABC-type lipoprotein export system ATPase subunit